MSLYWGGHQDGVIKGDFFFSKGKMGEPEHNNIPGSHSGPLILLFDHCRWEVLSVLFVSVIYLTMRSDHIPESIHCQKCKALIMRTPVYGNEGQFMLKYLRYHVSYLCRFCNSRATTSTVMSKLTEHVVARVY